MFTRTMTTSTIGRTGAMALVLAALLGGLLVALNPATADAQAGRTHVTLTVRVHGCKACDLTLTSVDAHGRTWSSHTKRARNGMAVFTPTKAHAHGLTVSVEPEWERHASIPTGYETLAVMRYHGVAAGKMVTTAQARAKRIGTPCWAGTSADRSTLNLAVRKVRLEGTTGPTWGTLAWANPQVRVTGRMYRLDHGIFGTQAVIAC